MDSLQAHVSHGMVNGQIINGRINGVQTYKGKVKRTGMQGMAGTNTGSGKANKALLGNAHPPITTRGKLPPVLIAGLPKQAAQNLGKPKSKFVMAFEAAKNSLNISTDSRAKAGGARPTKASTPSTKGAGID